MNKQKTHTRKKYTDISHNANLITQQKFTIMKKLFTLVSAISFLTFGLSSCQQDPDYQPSFEAFNTWKTDSLTSSDPTIVWNATDYEVWQINADSVKRTFYSSTDPSFSSNLEVISYDVNNKTINLSLFEHCLVDTFSVNGQIKLVLTTHANSTTHTPTSTSGKYYFSLVE